MQISEAFAKIQEIGQYFIREGDSPASFPFDLYLRTDCFGFKVEFENLFTESFEFPLEELELEPAEILTRLQEKQKENAENRERFRELRNHDAVIEFLRLGRNSADWESETYEHISYGK